MSIADRYQWLFRKSPALSVSLNQDGYFLDASDAWLTRFGYSRDELTALRPQDVSSPESTRRIVEAYMPLLRRVGRLTDVPVELLTKTGDAVACLANVVAEREEDGGDHVRTVAVYTELGAETHNEQHYRDIYRDTPAMLHTVDSRGRIVYVSDRWLTKLGYRREEVIGRNITDFMADDSRRSLDQRALVDIIAQGELDNAPRNYLTKDGEKIEALVSARADRDEDGQVTTLYVALKDVTKRNRAERQLRAAFEENARLREELERERDYLREEVQVSMNFGRIIGESQALKKMLARLEAVAQTSASVLIQGESGVGKELVAHVIHARSPRANGPLVKVNCASIPHELFESEFFGHVKGAFTGAYRDRIGRFQLADGGTLFLDEISEIPIELQGKLLRVLQESQYERVGDDTTLSVDVRVVAATNRDLEELVEQGGFREDLYYRLSVFPIEVPPLRERGEDIVQLASHFLEKACIDFGHRPLTLSRQQVSLLNKYDWPGNVRELKNVIERGVILSQGKVLRLDLAMADILRSSRLRESKPDRVQSQVMTEQDLVALQKENLLAALSLSNGRVSGPEGAAQLIGLKPSTFTDRMKKLGIGRKRETRSATA
ncbi:MAG: sigma 54-interacting transcriptional regulator [Gammaproteobacteria bacterium]|nr:sigma 54-interacting transcriptional regulator [Gammaproteobacteria bacterium]